MRTGPARPAWRGQGHPGQARSPSASGVPRDLDRRHLPGERLAGHAAGSRGPAVHGRRRVRPGLGHQRDGPRPAGRSRTPSPASCWTATRARSAQVDELDAMLAERGQPWTRSSSSTWTSRRSSPAAQPRRPSEGRADDTEEVIRRRHGGVRRADRAAGRRLRERGLLRRGRRHRRGRRGHRAASSRPVPRRGAEAPRVPARGPDPGQDARAGRADAARPAWWSAAPSSCCAAAASPGVTTGELDAHGRGRTSATTAAVPVVPRLPVPRRTTSPARICARSTTRSSTASPGAGCCGDGDLVSIDCGAIVDGLARRRRDHRRGRRGRPPEPARAARRHRGRAVARAWPPPGSAAG